MTASVLLFGVSVDTEAGHCAAFTRGQDVLRDDVCVGMRGIHHEAGPLGRDQFRDLVGVKPSDADTYRFGHVHDRLAVVRGDADDCGKAERRHILRQLTSFARPAEEQDLRHRGIPWA